ncbi:MAG: hypothetical protein HQL51_09575 [Magnetococcales bacterium]|nr:hypothetical protein [Magnetococcales bacterium]
MTPPAPPSIPLPPEGPELEAWIERQRREAMAQRLGWALLFFWLGRGWIRRTTEALRREERETREAREKRSPFVYVMH